MNRIEQQNQFLVNKFGLNTKQHERPKEGIFKTVALAANGATCEVTKKDKMLKNEDDSASSEEDKVEKTLFSHEYSKGGNSKKRHKKKLEAQLILQLENALGTSQNVNINSDYDVEKASKEKRTEKRGVIEESKKIKKGKKKKLKINGDDHLTTKALEMLAETVGQDANTSETIKGLKKKKKLEVVDNQASTKTSEKSVKRKRLKSDSDDTSMDESEARIEEINERMDFVQGLKKITRSDNFGYENGMSQSKRKKKKKNKASLFSKKCEKLTSRLNKELDLS